MAGDRTGVAGPVTELHLWALGAAYALGVLTGMRLAGRGGR